MEQLRANQSKTAKFPPLALSAPQIFNSMEQLMVLEHGWAVRGTAEN